jgi:hypothetical protein
MIHRNLLLPSSRKTTNVPEQPVASIFRVEDQCFEELVSSIWMAENFYTGECSMFF